ncbi:hypothetical protein T05_2391 [Trichinella murrelli]|uniref:Uncharacterized protein n=1 Tax=Trichinella murrelli TaxID=144512 RepID=A0A0V0STU1_9BILA|nr:hypothetical protein T05_2391 [Trichinella murrelli]
MSNLRKPVLNATSAPVKLTLLTNRSIDSDVCSIYFCFNY